MRDHATFKSMLHWLKECWHRAPELGTPFFFKEPLPKGEALKDDIFAGLTVAAVLIPQSMALAITAGIPPVYGLYASLFGSIGSMWGSSRYLSTGPVAIISVMTLTSLVPLANPNTPEYIALAAILALIVGCLYIAAGVLRLGFLVHLVPHTVITGFASAAALIIIATQIPNMLGISVSPQETFLETLWNIGKAAENINPITATISIGGVVLILLVRRFYSRIPGPILLVLAATVASFFFHTIIPTLSIVGNIPSGLPSFTFPSLRISDFIHLLPKAGIIALVGFVEAYSIAKLAAMRRKQKLDIDQELVGQGIANLGSGLFHGFPVSGSFSRTAINIDAGAISPYASLVTALCTLLVALFFTPLFYYLPHSVLSAIVVAAAIPLLNLHWVRELLRVSKSDGYVALATFALALIFTPDVAIFIGIVLALMFFLQQTVWGARITEMAIHPKLNILRRVRNIDEHLETIPGTVIVHVGAPLYYANAAFVIEQMEKLAREHVEREQVPVKRVVIDASAISFADSTGVEVLGEYLDEWQAKGVETDFIYLRTQVHGILTKSKQFPKYTWYKNISEMSTHA